MKGMGNITSWYTATGIPVNQFMNCEKNKEQDDINDSIKIIK